MPANPNLEAATGSKVRIFVVQISILGPLLPPLALFSALSAF